MGSVDHGSAVPERIYLSPPHMGGREEELLTEAVRSNWIAPLGPHVDAFEREFARKVGADHAVAVSSGTAALHLALELAGVGAGDEVLVSSLTFCASVNPVRYVGGVPVLIDSESESWNMDPDLVCSAVERKVASGRLPAAVIVVHLYGQSANLDPIIEVCQRHGIPLIEDAAEALGATYRGAAPGTLGDFGIFSFNGNKIITTSGGGMLVTPHAGAAAHARKLATQAREPAPHYEHTEIGYNYRLSNLLAAVGRGQLEYLDDRVKARRQVFREYLSALATLPGIEFMPEAPWGRHSRWLTCMTVDPHLHGADRETIRLALEAQNIEARPIWKPMHLQPVFRDCEWYGRGVSDELFRNGLCLPSGSALTQAQIERIVGVVESTQAR